jgi:hypothetical protein
MTRRARQDLWMSAMEPRSARQGTAKRLCDCASTATSEPGSDMNRDEGDRPGTSAACRY